MTPLVLAICLGILSHYSILIHAGSTPSNSPPTVPRQHTVAQTTPAITKAADETSTHSAIDSSRIQFLLAAPKALSALTKKMPASLSCRSAASVSLIGMVDECAPPPNHSVLAGPNNFNGSVCLNYQCMWANATLGNDCVVENTPYISYEAGTGNKFINVVSRGNCEKDLYCDSQTLKCMTTRQIGDKCDADKECESDNCTQEGVCGSLLNAPKHLPVAVYVVVGLCIVGVMVGVIVGLYVLHRRHRAEEREKRAQYWREQEQFRQNIMQMREQARGSLLSLPWQGQPSSPQSRSGPIDSGVYSPSDTSPTPMLYAASQPSGLRNGFSDNGFDDDKEEGSMEESLVMKAAPRGVGGTATRRHNPHPKRI
ncbi:hypothetical protein FRB99_006832 [Tulasnella sp. 403]|nr:hypothetical protein FRB99_006832 [Tulasnella sp. 403]